MNGGALARSIQGTVIARPDDAYEPARRALAWNQLTPERRPDLLVGAANVADVIAAVDFARRHRLRITVRSGGHAWWGGPSAKRIPNAIATSPTRSGRTRRHRRCSRRPPGASRSHTPPDRTCCADSFRPFPFPTMRSR